VQERAGALEMALREHAAPAAIEQHIAALEAPMSALLAGLAVHLAPLQAGA
jgi:hypothetical protein